jgi:hypothetical protein
MGPYVRRVRRAPARHRRAVALVALVVAILAFGAAVFLHVARFSVSGVSATVPQWRRLCGSVPGWMAGAAARSRCGEMSLAYHATAGLVLLALLLGAAAIVLFRPASLSA